MVIICKKFGEKKLRGFLKENVTLFVPKFKKLCEEEDLEAIENYTEMFIDFADCEIDSLIQGNENDILNSIILGFSFEGRQFKQT